MDRNFQNYVVFGINPSKLRCAKKKCSLYQLYMASETLAFKNFKTSPRNLNAF